MPYCAKFLNQVHALLQGIELKILFYLEFVPPGLEPFGPMTLAALAMQRGHKCDFLIEYDTYGFVKEMLKKLKLSSPDRKRLDSKIMKKVGQFRPDVIAYSVQTGTHNHSLYINRLLKDRFSFISVFGGPHATFFPEMAREKGVDYVMRGECERSFVHLLERLEKKKAPEDVRGIVFARRGKMVNNDVGQLVEDLDSLPFPAREILYDKYPFLGRSWMKSFMTSRGCPYDCTYCFNHALRKLYSGKGNLLRQRSVKNVINEIIHIKEKYGLKHVMIQDDTFILNPKWVTEFCRQYRKKVNLPFTFQARANLVTGQMIKELSEAGAVSATMAIESGNDHLRNDILKRRMSKEMLVNASAMMRKYGIRFLNQNIIGLPEETWETAMETLDLNIRCRPTYAYTSLFQPFPKTELGEYAEKIGIFDGDYSRLASLSFHDDLHTDIDKDLKKRLVNLQKLFAVVVRFPFLKRLLPLLVKAPKNNLLYRMIYYAYKRYIFTFYMHIR